MFRSRRTSGDVAERLVGSYAARYAGARQIALVAALLAGLVPAGCAPPPPVVSVTPTPSAIDQPLKARTTGLGPRATATVSVGATGATGLAWEGHASYAASSDGVVDPDTATSTGGTYKGVHAMGLVSSMQPPKGSFDTAGMFFTWGTASTSLTWTVTVDGA